MKFGKAEWAAILLTVTLLAFAGGFFWGRSTVPDTLRVESAVPIVSPYTMPEGSACEEEAGSVTEADSAETEPILFPVDINRADVSHLEGLPGIGPVLARRIVDYREAHGSFEQIEDIKNVSGIGEKTYSEIINLIKVGE